MGVVSDHIIDCMVGFVNNYQNNEHMYERLDELFLLWSKRESQSFVKSVEDFGLNYKSFSEKDYEAISSQIIKQYPEKFPDMDDIDSTDKVVGEKS